MLKRSTITKSNIWLLQKAIIIINHFILFIAIIVLEAYIPEPEPRITHNRRL